MIPLLLWSGKVFFLVALYGFIFFVVRTAIRDMRLVEASRVAVSRGALDPAEWGVEGRPVGSGEKQAVWPAVWRLGVVSSPCLPVGHVVVLPRRGRVILGRGVEADIRLPDTFVSSRHASIEEGEEGLLLTDLGSTNGTILNGAEIQGTELLEEEDRVEVGDTVFVVEAG